MNRENKMEQRLRELTRVPIDLFVSVEDVEHMKQGEEGTGYIEVLNIDGYELINKHAFQPAVQLDDNTFRVTFIMK